MPDPRRIENALRQVRDPQSFIQHLLIDALGWPVEKSAVEVEDIGYAWTAGELRAEGFEKKLVDGAIHQIGPFRGNPWGIFLLEFQRPDVFTTGRGMTGVVRKVLRGLVEKKRAVRNPKLAAFRRETLLFICTHGYTHYRFACFKAPLDGARTAPLAAFGWGPGDAVRTVCEYNLSALEWPDRPLRDAHGWISAWGAAFDVEKVTKRFYEDYRAIFERAESRIKAHTPLRDNDLRLFTQSLFNRIMFLRFIERKGWLAFPGQTGRNYLAALMDAGPMRGKSFYRARLRPLFFEGMAVEGSQSSDAYGRVPFLNGGLFEEGPLDKRVTDLPDEIFAPIIGATGLFYRYNFTVEESTPLDIEVAVDPEMLGKVFEELVTGRHESGSYYTPRPVVSFMCREALKGYLRTRTDASEVIVARLVDQHDPSGLSEGRAHQVTTALDTVKAVDPACGSGAYLLGLMHELIAIRRALRSERLVADPQFLYDLKLHIISRNLYGVDLDPFATSIARLRLWLSLIIEADQPLPLPNLDFKIEQGDSILSPDPSGGAQPDLHRHVTIETFDNLKRQYLREKDRRRKLEIQREIAEARRAILEYGSQWARREHRTPEGTLDWRIEFAEVWNEAEGFDIVLANPPYVRQELIRNLKEQLKAVYRDLYVGTADLYCYFYLRALQLLRPGGMLVFISSNKWFRANYGKTLRQHVAETCHVESITDFGDLPVFEATAYPMIFVAQKRGTPRGTGVSPVIQDHEQDAHATVFTQVESLEPPYPDVRALIHRDGQRLPASAISGPTWTLAAAAAADRLRKMEQAGIPLGEYVNGQIHYGIKTGFNKAFVIDGEKRAELTAQDRKSAEIVKPLAMGKDIRKWAIDRKDRWLIVTKIGVDIKRYPAVFRHLKQWQPELERRYDKGRHWWELRACDYYDEFEKPKIVFPDISKEARFALCEGPMFLGNTGYIIPVSDPFLVGVLNSDSVTAYYSEISSQVRGDYLRFIYQYVSQIPIPEASSAERRAIERLVRKCIDAGGVDCGEWEREINERVAALYGL
ncbi:MAG TPA: TaqI-like C-terminal specificity domain-containing protein [Candidatus Hydrogenedentes bacterium]|nr:TaqI-like C-terminal specificity domain-containing protein [Candidatus Hydrogenedentota bacterium]